jgi:small conductance mechanosensitive channel
MLLTPRFGDGEMSLQKSVGPLRKVADTLFGGNSLLILLACVIIALVVGKFCTVLLRRLSRSVGKQADESSDLGTVNRLRRIETWIILSIAIVRVVLLVVGLYFWWIISHPHQQPTALVGASALLAIVLGGVFSPLLRDFAFGGGMMAEHWFGVGDLITIEPNGLQGVVERITLRSTRIRGLNGEIIWMANQNISGVRIAQKGVWTLAIELFVTDPKKAEALIAQTNALLPAGPSLLVNPLGIMTADERGAGLWHVTAIGETAPGREWLLERTAIDLLKKLDERSKNPILITDPVARFADNETERQFARAVRNAKKTRRPGRRPKLTVPKSKPKH